MTEERNYIAGLNQMLVRFRMDCKLPPKALPSLIKLTPDFYKNLRDQLIKTKYDEKKAGHIYGIKYEIIGNLKADAMLYE